MWGASCKKQECCVCGYEHKEEVGIGKALHCCCKHDNITTRTSYLQFCICLSGPSYRHPASDIILICLTLYASLQCAYCLHYAKHVKIDVQNVSEVRFQMAISSIPKMENASLIICHYTAVEKTQLYLGYEDMRWHSRWSWLENHEGYQVYLSVSKSSGK